MGCLIFFTWYYPIGYYRKSGAQNETHKAWRMMIKLTFRQRYSHRRGP